MIICSCIISLTMLVKNPNFHACTKHIKVHYHDVRERIIEGVVNHVAMTPMFHNCTKHTEVHYHYAREKITCNIVDLKHMKLEYLISSPRHCLSLFTHLLHSCVGLLLLDYNFPWLHIIAMQYLCEQRDLQVFNIDTWGMDNNMWVEVKTITRIEVELSKRESQQ
mgnify:CR=1 FL=1